jgi:hypothetical protein
MLYELNAYCGKTLLLQQKIIEIIKTCPKHYSEYLSADYYTRLKEMSLKSVCRSVIFSHKYAYGDDISS